MSQVHTWLITGANRGIGLESVRQILVGSSDIVFACCRDPANASALKDIASEFAGRVHVVPLDVGDPASISSSVQFAKTVLDEHGLDYLLNNAAINHGVDDVFESMTAEIMMHAFQVNVIGPALVAQTYLPFLEKPGKRGVIMNMSTGLASNGLGDSIDPNAKCPSYSISKAGVNMLTGKQARSRKNLISLAIDPGWVKTAMGGPGAQIEVAESVRDLLKFLRSADRSHAGKFFNRKGEVEPW